MDCRTQGTAGGLLLVRRHSRVRVLHTSTVMEAISLVRGRLRPRLDVQAGCRHSSAGAAAARCLAAESRRENLAVEAVARKTAARDPLGRVKRADLHRAAAGGRHDLLVPADTRRSCATRGGRLCNLCLSDNLAVSAGAALSVSVERAAGDSHRLSCAAHRDHGAGVGVSRASAVSALRLALVRGRVAPDDRSGAGRRAVTRGPIRLYPCDGPARDGRLGRRPVADGAPAHTRDGTHHSGSDCCPGGDRVRAGSLLEKQRHAAGTHARGDGGQSRGASSPRLLVGDRRTPRRGRPVLSGVLAAESSKSARLLQSRIGHGGPGEAGRSGSLFRRGRAPASVVRRRRTTAWAPRCCNSISSRRRARSWTPRSDSR